MLRWHGRFTRQVRDVTSAEAQAVLALLLLLPGRRGKAAARALAQLLDAPYMRQAPICALVIHQRGVGRCAVERREAVRLLRQRLLIVTLGGWLALLAVVAAGGCGSGTTEANARE